MPTVTDTLKYANLQIAAEAILNEPWTGKKRYDGQDLIAALVKGNNRQATRLSRPPAHCAKNRRPK